jgi:ABC-type nitrate/sulfonate/bicarbonate transport system substrate-binding protein
MALGLVLTAVACGNGSTKSSTPAPKDHITVTLPTVQPSFYAVYYAQKTGIFDRLNLDVSTIDNAGSNVLNLVVSGQADLGFIGTTSPLLAADQGKEVSIVRAGVKAGTSGLLVSRPEITDVSQLKGKTVATLGPGTLFYGYSQLYIHRDNLGFNVRVYNDAASEVGAFKAKQVDALLGVWSTVQPLLADKSANLLIDSWDPAVFDRFIGLNFLEGCLFGMKANLGKRPDVVSRFLKGLDEAYAAIKQKPAADTIATLSSNPAIKQGLSTEVLTALLEKQKPRLPIEARISKEQWVASLTAFASFGLQGFDASNPKYAYGAVVDMSYLGKASP